MPLVINVATSVTFEQYPTTVLGYQVRYCLNVTDVVRKAAPQGLFAREHLLLAWRCEVEPKPASRAFLFDLGASLYSKGLGGASLKWFTEEYKVLTVGRSVSAAPCRLLCPLHALPPRQFMSQRPGSL